MSAKVYSLNYDFLPTIAYGDKCFWADLRWPVPDNLKIGTIINFISSDKDLIPPRGVFRISDIVGSRVVIKSTDPRDSFALLTYFKAKNDRGNVKAVAPNVAWSPLQHGPQWGYATRNMASNPASGENWTYGNGGSVLSITW